MIDALIALAVVAIFALGLRRALAEPPKHTE
jgi:hypothetical protein